MRFTIRTLLILTLMVSAAFGLVAIKQAIWLNHCQRLQPSLFAFVLQAELDQVRKATKTRESSSLSGGPLPRDTPERIFLAMGRSQPNGTWLPPSRTLLNEIGSTAVRSVSERQGNDPVYVLQNIRWIDWDTVILDKEQTQGAVRSAIRNMKLVYVNGDWEIAEAGDYWEESTDLSPLSTSNSGMPF